MEIPRVEPRSGRLKRCNNPRCRLWLPIDEFQRDGRCADGRRGECKDCRSRRRRALKLGFRRFKPWEKCGSVAAKARAFGFKKSTVHDRLTRGWSLPRALLTPVK